MIHRDLIIFTGLHMCLSRQEATGLTLGVGTLVSLLQSITCMFRSDVRVIWYLVRKYKTLLNLTIIMWPLQSFSCIVWGRAQLCLVSVSGLPVSSPGAGRQQCTGGGASLQIAKVAEAPKFTHPRHCDKVLGTAPFVSASQQLAGSQSCDAAISNQWKHVINHSWNVFTSKQQL